MTIWGIHNDTIAADELVADGFVSLGWEKVPDLRTIGTDREAMKATLAEHFPTAKEGAIRIWAGILLRLGFEMQPGDLVIAPNKSNSTLNFGKITGPYRYVPNEDRHPHRRNVEWLRTDIPRGLFPQSALYEVGSALALFKIQKHAQVFIAFLNSESEDAFLNASASDEPDTVEAVVPDDQDAGVTQLPTAEAIEQNTSDFITRTLLEELSDREFELFTADLLRAMGYEARATEYVGDGGVDVIAHRDSLGLQPPIIKVQCKHTALTMGRPDIQRLLGTLAPGEEHGLFVSLGTYSKDARGVERERQNLRLLGGPEISQLVTRHYEQLPSKWRDRMPLRRVYVVERQEP